MTPEFAAMLYEEWLAENGPVTPHNEIEGECVLVKSILKGNNRVVKHYIGNADISDIKLNTNNNKCVLELNNKKTEIKIKLSSENTMKEIKNSNVFIKDRTFDFQKTLNFFKSLIEYM